MTKKEKIEDITKQVEEKINEPEEKKACVNFISSGSDILDLIGGGGFPWGKMINIVGDNSTGKTLIVSEFVAKARKIYGEDLIWFYDDAEAGYSFDSKTIWGIDIVAEDSKCSNTLEEFELNLNKLLDKLKSHQRLIYVLDSFDALTTEDEVDHNDKRLEAVETGKKLPGSYGQSKAKGSSNFFRSMKRKIKDKNCILIVISQVRENIGLSFGPRYVRNGGKALDFYAAQIFWLAVAEKHEKQGKFVGVTIKIKNSKNKVGKPYREGFIEILFDYGVDNIVSNLLYLYDLKTDTGKNKTGVDKTKLLWDEKEYTFKELIKYIEENNLEGELTNRVKQVWEKSEEKANMSIGRKSKI